MKYIIALFLLILTSEFSTFGQSEEIRIESKKFKTVILSPSYYCRSDKERNKGYQGTALFLSEFTKKAQIPDLLFSGNCQSEDFFQVTTAYDDYSLIVDFGTQFPAFARMSCVLCPPDLTLFGRHSGFQRTVKVQMNHAYGVVLNGRTRRGLFIFKVINYQPHEKVELSYAIWSYEINGCEEAKAKLEESHRPELKRRAPK